jgi:hypothetical protein
MLLCICQVRGSKGDGRHKRKRKYAPAREREGGSTFLTPLYSERLGVRACPLTCANVAVGVRGGVHGGVRGCKRSANSPVLSVMPLTCMYERVRPGTCAHGRVCTVLCGVVRARDVMGGGVGGRHAVRACAGVWGVAVDWSRQAAWNGGEELRAIHALNS